MAATGLRIGFVAGPQHIIQALVNIQGTQISVLTR